MNFCFNCFNQKMRSGANRGHFGKKRIYRKLLLFSKMSFFYVSLLDTLNKINTNAKRFYTNVYNCLLTFIRLPPTAIWPCVSKKKVHNKKLNYCVYSWTKSIRKRFVDWFNLKSKIIEIFELQLFSTKVWCWT